jgi:hypothetical protein
VNAVGWSPTTADSSRPTISQYRSFARTIVPVSGSCNASPSAVSANNSR